MDLFGSPHTRLRSGYVVVVVVANVVTSLRMFALRRVHLDLHKRAAPMYLVTADDVGKFVRVLVYGHLDACFKREIEITDVA